MKRYEQYRGGGGSLGVGQQGEEDGVAVILRARRHKIAGPGRQEASEAEQEDHHYDEGGTDGGADAQRAVAGTGLS